MMKLLPPITLLCYLLSSANAFVAPISSPPSSIIRARIAALRSSRLCVANNESIDLYIYSIDGTLASTTQYQSKVAIRAALEVWPSLHSVIEELGMTNITSNDDFSSTDDYVWLLNKLGALSSITQQGDSPDEMLGCDEVLLTRMLLEEQLLDGGRSPGTGKYGGKFHPTKSSSSTKSVGEKSRVGSRPLTVGEIFANWSELREVIHNKYPFIMRTGQDGKLKMADPLPEIREKLCKMYSSNLPDEKTMSKLWQPFVSDILKNSNNNNVLLLGNEAKLEFVLLSLKQFGWTLEIHSDVECLDSKTMSNTDSEKIMQVIVSDSNNAWRHIKQQQGKGERSLVIVVPNTETEEPQSDLIQSIVRQAASERDFAASQNIYVAHSSFDVLKNCKTFLGDDAPMLSNGLRQCVIATDAAKVSVTLFLPSWCSHPTQLNDAEMDPWLNVISEELFEELTSATIV